MTPAVAAVVVMYAAFTVMGWVASRKPGTGRVGLVAGGLAAAVPFALQSAGGLEASWLHYANVRPDGHGVVPAMFAGGGMGTWYDPATGAMLFPFKAFAAGAGVMVLPAVSRLSARWDPPRPLCNPLTDEDHLPAGEQVA